MTLPDYHRLAAGTALSWKNTGGDYALTLTSLANGSARQGAKGDLGASWARRYAVRFTSAVASAATNGTEVEVFWAASNHATAGTNNPGNTDGTDAALSSPDELKGQLIPLGSLVLSNARGTNTQTVYLELNPPTRYGMPVIVNKSGQALSATAGNHEFELTPILDKLEDT